MTKMKFLFIPKRGFKTRNVKEAASMVGVNRMRAVSISLQKWM